MNIAYISQSTVPSDKANSVHVMKMCQAFSANGHTVTLFSIKGYDIDNLYEYYGVTDSFRIINIKIPKFLIRGKGLYYSLKIKRCILKNSNYDLLYGRFLKSLLMFKKLNIPIIYESHALKTSRDRF